MNVRLLRRLRLLSSIGLAHAYLRWIAWRRDEVRGQRQRVDRHAAIRRELFETKAALQEFAAALQKKKDENATLRTSLMIARARLDAQQPQPN